MINVGIVGVSGYSGLTLLDILLSHPEVRVTYVSANNTVGKIEHIWPQLAKRCRLTCKPFNINEVDSVDLVFLAVPHTISMKIAPQLLKKGIKVIDLSGDYRLNSAAQYKKWYGHKHQDPQRLKKAVYGLPELFKADIKKSPLIANPGCYPTASLLALAPLLSLFEDIDTNIIIDAKSGVSGAGRKGTVPLSFSEVDDNFKAYKVLNHQHAPEIQQFSKVFAEKDVNIHFVPHLLPIKVGILATIYVPLKKTGSLSQIHKIYKRFYKSEPFVRISELGEQPEIKHVVKTNFCDIGLALSPDKKLLVITSVIDNLWKGAAGQAVQNMNLMVDFDEKEGLL